MKHAFIVMIIQKLFRDMGYRRRPLMDVEYEDVETDEF